MLPNRFMTFPRHLSGGCCLAFSGTTQTAPGDTRCESIQREGWPLSLIIAGGGTGGHLFPGIAIAQEVLAAGSSNQVRFIGTGNPFESRVLNQKGFEQERIQVKPLKGKTRFRQAAALAAIPASILASIKVLKKIRPDAVLGVGGYSAGPVVMAAWLLGIPTALHEQNLIPGITNRMLSCFADRIYVSFDDTRIRASGQKIRLTGNPVRKEICAGFENAVTATPGPLKTDKAFTVLIIGGSQGAHRINTTVMAALTHLKTKQHLVFIHQTGAADENEVRKAYRDQHIAATVKPFFDDMQNYYPRADLVICRAGASTIAELAVLGKSVIFIPYPYAADDHQAVNASQLVCAGAAEMILEKDLSARGLAETIEIYASSPEKRRSMAQNLKKRARPHAARHIVEDLYELVALKD